jgi:predicted Ser/Thr protein kinase
MNHQIRDLTETLFVLPPDAKLLPVSELSNRLRARIGPVENGEEVVTRPGFRITTRLVPAPLAALMREFREPSLLTNAVLRFSQGREVDPCDTLEQAFDALATLVEARILLPPDSPDTQAPEPSLAAGQEFAGLEIETLVRSLEDTEVYRARHSNGDSVALKVARDNRPALAQVLAKEARVLELLAGVDSPKLIHDGVYEGRSYVVMEWCDGVSITVKAQQARAARNRRQLHRIVSDMMQAYARLHANGVLHVDIHPGNCLIRDDGRVVLLDFGSARLIEAERDLIDPTRVGIPQFYDPMMATASLERRVPPAATAASEQYAISVLAYVLITGLHPIETTAVHDELLRNIVNRPPLPFSARGVAAWPAVEAVIRRGLAKSAGERFPDVSALSGSFASALRQPKLPHKRLDSTESALAAPIAAARNLQFSPEPPLYRAWFALRAALAFDDAELLAAADIFAGRAGPGYAAQSVVARIARARSDISGERQAIERFLTAGKLLDDGPEVVAAILAAAEILEGATSRHVDTAPLATWASRQVDKLMSAPLPLASTSSVAESQLLFVALALARTGGIAVPAGLPARLETFAKVNDGSTWLWALAHDIFSHEEYKARALAAKRPQAPVARGFVFLRLHQLTGEMRWVTHARRLVAKHPPGQLWENYIPLLILELKAPERVVLPSFLMV